MVKSTKRQDISVLPFLCYVTKKRKERDEKKGMEWSIQVKL